MYGEEVVAEKFTVDGDFEIVISQGMRKNQQAVVEEVVRQGLDVRDIKKELPHR
ncbi:hypothetical protein [Exiguobacterium artemiae]|uniref:hypothetical protein n=1 Tax=Exiguobacterium artemiae TaxID=340145 RepID=UPI0029641081|nr:hypothetical protein [Exiguobacterium sibiricum]MDW2886676.1 hypothetical protein [Exiguobacterium sibiricum]